MMPATCVSVDGTLGTISGLHGDLDLYEQIQRDLSTQRGLKASSFSAI